MKKMKRMTLRPRAAQFLGLGVNPSRGLRGERQTRAAAGECVLSGNAMTRSRILSLALAAFASIPATAAAHVLELTHDDQTVRLFGIKMVGLNPANGTKLLLTLAAVVAVWALGRLLARLARLLLGERSDVRARFWSEQGIHLFSTFLFVLLLVSIWFTDPARMATAFGLVSAGLAFALQKVVTAFAGYFVILRGRLFSMGDRIMIGGVRGDVMAIHYLRTTVMEMGQSPGEQKDDPAVWVQSRQYTGRIVTVTNDKLFDEPVFNYTRDFPYIWEEMHLPVSYRADRARAERILLDAAQRHSVPIVELSREHLAELKRRYFIEDADVAPRVYWRLTDNWLELSLRFIVPARGIRALKDKLTREILAALDEAGIEIASSTFEITGLPRLQIERPRSSST